MREFLGRSFWILIFLCWSGIDAPSQRIVDRTDTNKETSDGKILAYRGRGWSGYTPPSAHLSLDVTEVKRDLNGDYLFKVLITNTGEDRIQLPISLDEASVMRDNCKGRRQIRLDMLLSESESDPSKLPSYVEFLSGSSCRPDSVAILPPRDSLVLLLRGSYASLGELGSKKAHLSAGILTSSDAELVLEQDTASTVSQEFELPKLAKGGL